jgi:hypothetical protein
MRYSLVILACLATAFGVAEEATLSPTKSLEGGENDQDSPFGGSLGKEPNTEASENTKSVVDELPPPEGNEVFTTEEEEPPEDENLPDDLPPDADIDLVEEEVELPEDETPEIVGETPETVGEDEDLDAENGEEISEVESSETSEQDEDFDVEGEGEKDEGVDVIGEGDEETETISSEIGEVAEEDAEEPEGVDEGEGDFPPLDETDNSSGFIQRTGTPSRSPRHTPYPTVQKQPSLRPVVPYVSTDDDPLKDDEDEAFEDWGLNKATVEEVEKEVEKDVVEMAHDTKVVIALSTVFGVMFFFSVFVAYQMLENPNGCCASLCRISVACWCGLTRCICYPCRAMCGCTGEQSGGRQDHMMLPNDGHFTHDLELS